MNMKIALLNFTHQSVKLGGVETRYQLLEHVLQLAGHSPKRISTTASSAEQVIIATDESDLVISDSAVCVESSCPMITVFGNPWRSVLETILPEEEKRIRYIAQREKRWHASHKTTRVAVSNFMAAEMEKVGINADHVIPNPATVDRFVGQSRKLVPPAVLWCGSKAQIKQYGQVSKIQKRWDGRHIQWKMAIKEREELDYKRMTAAYLGASLTLCTSWAEGCSNALMESMAANVPIVTSRTGLFWNWWDERLGERIDNPSDTEGYVRSIKAILQSPEKYSPRAVAMEHKLDFRSWASAWQRLVLEAAKC